MVSISSLIYCLVDLENLTTGGSMNHETLQALYALDVAEVGEEEAAKRWEYYIPGLKEWRAITPDFGWTNLTFRRKPDLPWPKVMQPDTKTEWPADAPEWANYRTTDANGHTRWWSNKPEYAERLSVWSYNGNSGETKADSAACPNWRNSLIERPKLVLKKIDWSRMLLNPDKYKYGGGKQPSSDWIAWNCDENTRGNPLPDGLKVEALYLAQVVGIISSSIKTNWSIVTRFRITGIQEGWE